MNWTPQLRDEHPDLAQEVAGFYPDGPLGRPPAKWLRKHALDGWPGVRVRLCLVEDRVAAFHSLVMGDVFLTEGDARLAASAHLRPGAVLLPYFCKAQDSPVGWDSILLDVLEQAYVATRHVGASVLAVDPATEEVAQHLERLGFAPTREAKRAGRPLRVWRRLNFEALGL